MKGLFTPSLLIAVLSLSGCEFTLEDKEKLDQASKDLSQLADQIIITYPVKESVVSDSFVTVHADIPDNTELKELRLIVDGKEIAADTDGAPWEIRWPAYYFADGNKHSLLLKAITTEDVFVRNNEQFQLTVSTEANDALSFSNELNGTQLQGQDTISISFAGFPGASRYQVHYDGQIIETNDTTVELTGLNVGSYDIRYRAIFDYSELNTLTGPFSEVATIDVLAPTLPSLTDPLIVNTEGNYQVTLSWQEQAGENNYEVFWGLEGDSISLGSTSEASFNVSNVVLGNYEFALKRTNSLGQASEKSEITPVSVGVFRTQLGGSQDDRARQIIKSKQGGYLVRATTKSYEVSETLNGTDDWIIRLNEQGNVLDELVLNTESPYIHNMYETDDGYIYLVGRNSATKEAVFTKLNSNLELQWDILFKPDEEAGDYFFTDIVEWNNKIYVSASSSNGALLHEITPENGSVSGSITLPSIEGIKIESYKELFVSSAGSLVIAGYAFPSIRDENAFMDGGAFLLTLNSNFDAISSWNNVDEFQHINVGSAIELSNGRFAIIGQSFMGVEPAISVINESGTEHRYFQGSDYYGSANLESNGGGGFYGFFKDQSLPSPFPIKLVEFNENSIPVSAKYVLDESGYLHEAGIVKNADSSLTILFNAGQNENKNYDIVVKRISSEY